ncbi:phage tail protein [Acinetobacter junii]|uniref:phage tail protein n=1 Tax=Acinetobacter junii TaxID=40215 RepID=UPI001F15EC60|nr:phage tail protein [Acinetobacter junii]
MGGSSSQTIGYKYFAGLQVVVGNCIEYIININPDNRGWIFTKPEEIDILKTGDISITVNKPNLFGGDKAEGGWVGIIDIHTGKPETLRQNEYLAEQDSSLVSSFPYLSHLVFRGSSLDKGFQLVSMSGMLKEVLYWVKRIHVKDDGSPQWYDVKSEVPIQRIIDVGGNTSDDPLDIPEGLTISRNLIADGGTVISAPEVGEVVNKTLRFFGGGWSTSELTDLQDSSFISEVYLPYSRWKGTIAVRAIENGIISITGGEFSHIDNVDFSIYNIDFIGDKFSISIYVQNTRSIQWTYLNLQRFYAPLPLDYTGDINPIHKIREIITDDTAMNKPEAMINDSNFKASADRIWAEGLGVSGSFTEKSCKEAIDELLYHIEGGIRVNRQTGLYEIVLFRDDLLDLDNAQVFDKSNIKNFSIETANIDDVINSVNVNYYDRDNIKDSSFSLDELGSILSNQTNAETLDFPYFMNRRNAELVGNWKLKQLSTPTRKGSFTTGKYDARKINRYDVVKLTWLNQNMIEVPIRIMKIGLGDGRDNTVTLDWVEVIPYSSIVFPTINVDLPTSNVLPPQPNQSIAFEMPYFEAVQRFGQTQVDTELANNPDLGYLMVATKKPQNNSINALLFTDNGTGYQQTSIVDYCPVVQLDQDISYLDTSFAVKNVSSISQAEIGTLILCDEELMIYQSYDDVTKILTVKRAALDTVPKPHLVNAVFYFYDAFSAFDSEQYVLSEVIDAKVLTTTPRGVEELGDVTALSVEMDARAIRPYPPANVKINDEYYPDEIVNDLIVTWVDRNRLQQTGGSILGWTDGGVAKEQAVEYSLKLTGLDSNTTIFEENGILTNSITVPGDILEGNNQIELWSERDAIESYMRFKHTFKSSNVIPDVMNKFIGASFLGDTSIGHATISPHASTVSGDSLILVITQRGSIPTAAPGSDWSKIYDSNSPAGSTLTSAMKVSVWKKTAVSITSEFINHSSDYRSVGLYTFRNASISLNASSELSQINSNKALDSSIFTIVIGNGYANTESSTQLTNQSDYIGRAIVLFDPDIYYAQQAHYLYKALKTTSVEINVIEHNGKGPYYSRQTIVLEVG